MCAEAIVEGSAGGKKMVGERDIRVYLDKCVSSDPFYHHRSARLCSFNRPCERRGSIGEAKYGFGCRFDKKYWATYKVLDILQKVFYRSNPAREAFVEMCESDYVQKMTFDSYLYKTVRAYLTEFVTMHLSFPD